MCEDALIEGVRDDESKGKRGQGIRQGRNGKRKGEGNSDGIFWSPRI